MNPHARHSISLPALLVSLWRSRQLIGRMIRSEVVGRYKGSVLGLGWSLVHPLLMLSVYTFVFSIAFKARWGLYEGESRMMFAIILFIGMIVHGLFSEILSRSATSIPDNLNYVKKVVFPLQVLPVVVAGAAVFHALVSLLAWLLFYLVCVGLPDWHAVFFPLVIFPLVLLSLGLGWALAALGASYRDVGQTLSIITTVLLFLSPVFYPIENIPRTLHPLIMANPLTFVIEQARAVLIWAQMPDFAGLLVYWALALLVFWAGFACFQKSRTGFADVL
ncbi:MAG: ABC transporter permease [Pseudomonas sp.]|uniref:ABC transporter permease n=1 Tax=Pseudomonas sp. TaxID=306 RepID=UPI0033985E15